MDLLPWLAAALVALALTGAALWTAEHQTDSGLPPAPHNDVEGLLRPSDRTGAPNHPETR